MRIRVLFALSSVFLVNCGGDETTVDASAMNPAAEECSKDKLAEQCPPNTVADITAEANRVCDAAGSIQVGDAAATTKNNESIERVCVGQTSCRVVCKLDTPCPYGVQSISPTDGVLCADLSSECGNGICDRGENPMACPADCGGEWGAGQKRCVDDKISTCTPRLRWEEAMGAT